MKENMHRMHRIFFKIQYTSTKSNSIEPCSQQGFIEGKKKWRKKVISRISNNRTIYPLDKLWLQITKLTMNTTKLHTLNIGKNNRRPIRESHPREQGRHFECRIQNNLLVRIPIICNCVQENINIGKNNQLCIHRGPPTSQAHDYQAAVLLPDAALAAAASLQCTAADAASCGGPWALNLNLCCNSLNLNLHTH